MRTNVIDTIVEELRAKIYPPKSSSGNSNYYSCKVFSEAELEIVRNVLFANFVDISTKLAELEAKTTAYEAIIKNSNFKPILEYKTIFKDENGRIEGI